MSEPRPRQDFDICWVGDAPDGTPPKTPPDRYPGIILCPGRYYHGIAFMSYPRWSMMPKGGDTLGCLWRKAGEPMSWQLLFRNRYYHQGPNTHLWDGKDDKNWTSVGLRGPEEFVAVKFREFFEGRGTMTEEHLKKEKHPKPQLNLEIVLVRGDHTAFKRMIEQGKFSWMHTKTGDQLRVEREAAVNPGQS